MFVKPTVKFLVDRYASSHIDTNRGTFNMSLAHDRCGTSCTELDCIYFLIDKGKAHEEGGCFRHTLWDMVFFPN